MKIRLILWPWFLLAVAISSIISFGLPKNDLKIPATTPAILPATINIPAPDSISLRDSVVNFGLKFLGTPYAAGGSSRTGFDCSGFVHFVFRHYNIQVPRSSSGFGNFGKEIPIDSVKKGDILVFLSPSRNAIGHVGIVVNPKGAESEFIHASSGIEMKVIITSLKQPRYKRRFVKAVDVY
jgi:cell wall-associated NlpC family hydrolase